MIARSRRLSLGLAVVLAAVLAGTAAAERKLVGELFPPFEATDAVTGDAIALEALRGKVVLIDFWATWCGPCRRELPYLKQAYARFHDQGFEIVSISLDRSADRFAKYVADESMNWPQIMEGGSWKTRLARAYDIHSIPATYLIDASGVCVAQRVRGRALEGDIERALARPPVDPPTPAPAAVDDTQTPEPPPARRLGSIAREVEGAARLNRSFGQRLESARRSAEILARELPEPAFPDTTRRRYQRMHENLVVVRQTLFVAGLLGDAGVALPPDPFADGATDRSAFEAALAMLPDTVAAAETLERGVAELAKRLATARGDLATVRAALETAASTPEHAARVADAERAAAAAIRPWRATLTQTTLGLDTLTRRTDDPAQRARLDAAGAERDQLRAELASAGNDRERVAAIHDRFWSLCAEILSVHDAVGGHQDA